MAKIIGVESTILGWARIAAFGALFGIALWLASVALAQFVVQPLSCGINGGTTQCAQALPVSSGIATIIVTVVAIFVGIIMRFARPAVVAISSALMLWGLATWTDGLFWLEALIWSAFVGVLMYLLFGWLNRTQSLAIAIILTALIVIVERIVLTL